jgi:hypothetical protein
MKTEKILTFQELAGGTGDAAVATLTFSLAGMRSACQAQNCSLWCREGDDRTSELSYLNLEAIMASR